MTSHIRAGADPAIVRPKRQPFARSRRVYRWLAVIFALGIVAQVFFAGAALFGGGNWMRWHSMLGHLLVHPLPLIPLVLVILSFVGRLPATDRWLSGALLFLALLQPSLIYIGRGQQLPLLAALHPVNALFIFVLPLVLVFRSWNYSHVSGG